MTRFALLPILALLAASCGAEEAREEAPPQPLPTKAPAAAAPIPAPPEQRISVSEAAFTADSAQGAAGVVQTYYALIEAGKYDEAWRLRWESNDASDADAAAFAASFGKYREYHATIGAPSEIAGAAGSLYVEVPVQAYGRLVSGRPFGTGGTVTLRRVNDVPGSTPEQRKWRIYSH